MKTNFSHTLVSSFHLWFENHLLENQCYETGLTNNYTAIPLEGLDSNYICYQGEYRQLVAESSNVTVPNSGFFADGDFVTGDSSQSNIYTDYENGRLIVPLSSGSGINFTQNATVREVNTYPANDDPENTLIYSDFIENGEANSYLFGQTGKLPEKTYITPCCITSLVKTENKPFCFGGEEESLTKIRVVVIAKDNFTIDGLIGIFADTERATIANIDYSNYPYGIYNDVKSFPYTYSNLTTNLTRSLIKEVRSSKIKSDVSESILGKNLKIGFLDFTLSTYRFPSRGNPLATDDGLILVVE